jgi:16S rRNA (cytosine1402-N4)-methyltransferase
MTPTDPGAQHVPVMLEEIVTWLSPALRPAPGNGPAPVLLDCTLGLGGHAQALLTACAQARLVGLDRDPEALAAARNRLDGFAGRIHLIQARFDELETVLAGLRLSNVAAILFDLGLSSLQIDRTDRGFSYATDAALDMRMDPAQSLTAADVVAGYSQRELARVLRTFGQERFAGRIAAAVVAARQQRTITTSAQLVDIIATALPAAARHRSTGHPAKRTFQALRIEVNDELESLRRALPAAIAALDVGGRIAVLAYHSGEDRIVKQDFGAAARDRAPRDLPVVPVELQPELKLLTGKPMRPTSDEIHANPRAGSARLRVASRIRPQTNSTGDQETAR